ncbi:MAG TPA: NAD-dependent epimerase/dehydratase family protein [Candidatus Diapherotrites archaeon]|uniref:NAD-dependent epimerase/dehydratase family protein n=1 Tax=Candidatus Iainarchaeum sp. TaxID=3101447 RepID=A0A7J4IUP9_9ARCH|nr:NAD-dependent epimerase/dehydratase family protein [Candidatus Diapherotrites archaeon]
MKVLVTGAAGFIGSNLCRSLIESGAQVIGMDNFSGSYDASLKRRNIEPLLESRLMEFHEADIGDDRAYHAITGKGITHAVHLAARTGVRDSTTHAADYLATNIISSLKVLEFAKAEGARNVVLASTSSAYGMNKPPFSESQPISTPMSIYAASKIGMESASHAFFHLHSLPITVLRFFTVYGPGGRPDMAVYRFTDLITKRKPVEVYGDGSQRRDFTYVSDIVAGIMLAMDKGKGFGIYNLGHSESHTITELVSLLEQKLGKKAKVMHIRGMREDAEATLADISKAKKELGYRPRVALDEGLDLFVGWFKEYKASLQATK